MLTILIGGFIAEILPFSHSLHSPCCSESGAFDLTLVGKKEKWHQEQSFSTYVLKKFHHIQHTEHKSTKNFIKKFMTSLPVYLTTHIEKTNHTTHVTLVTGVGHFWKTGLNGVWKVLGKKGVMLGSGKYWVGKGVMLRSYPVQKFFNVFVVKRLETWKLEWIKSVGFSRWLEFMP